MIVLKIWKGEKSKDIQGTDLKRLLEENELTNDDITNSFYEGTNQVIWIGLPSNLEEIQAKTLEESAKLGVKKADEPLTLKDGALIPGIVTEKENKGEELPDEPDEGSELDNAEDEEGEPKGSKKGK